MGSLGQQFRRQQPMRNCLVALKALCKDLKNNDYVAESFFLASTCFKQAIQS
jgi:hypothetical protein